MIIAPDTDSGELAAVASAVIDAIHRDRLSTWAGVNADSAGSAGPIAMSVRIACGAISGANERERDRLVGVLGATGVAVADTSVSDQRHTVGIHVAPDDAARAAEAIRNAGYRSSRVWTGGAAASQRRTGEFEILTRDGAATTVVQLRWRALRSGDRSGSRRRMDRVFAPTAADWDAVDLPTRWWWGYSVVRPLRVMAERVGLRSNDHGALEPFLSTPDSLIEPLLDFASVGVDDVVFDFGCGDGRFVVTAAAATGCRALGVEQSAELSAAAIDRATTEGVAARVRIVNGDATTIDLSAVTVVVLFLPMGVAARVVPDLLARLSPGARIVLHEQTPLASTIPPPDSVAAVIADDAVTVAHRWLVTSGVV